MLYVDEGQILTSAGTTAGIDLCLYLLRREHGARVANAIARRMVVPLIATTGRHSTWKRHCPTSAMLRTSSRSSTGTCPSMPGWPAHRRSGQIVLAAPVTSGDLQRILDAGRAAVLNAILIVALMATPGALVFGVANFPKALRWARESVDRLHPPPPLPQGPPIERLAADLSRISANLDALSAAGAIPGRILRVRSTTAAYDETLLLACRALDVEPAGAVVPLSSEERLWTEASLAGVGLRW